MSVNVDGVLSNVKAGRAERVEEVQLRGALSARIRDLRSSEMAMMIMRVLDAVVCPTEATPPSALYKMPGLIWKTPTSPSGESVSFFPTTVDANFPLGEGTYLALFINAPGKSALAIKGAFRQQSTSTLCELIEGFRSNSPLSLHLLEPDGRLASPPAVVPSSTVVDVLAILLMSAMPRASAGVSVGFGDLC
jgi:hypothetical protein